MYRISFYPSGPHSNIERHLGIQKIRENKHLIDGRIFEYTFADNLGNKFGSVAAYVPKKQDAHFIAFEVETTIPRIVTVEQTRND